MSYKNIDDRKACQRRWYLRNRESEIKRISSRSKQIRNWYIDYKKKLKCSTCPESDWRCLDFHHKDESLKKFNISEAWHRGFSIKRILEEINKCDVLCANCHRKIIFHAQ